LEKCFRCSEATIKDLQTMRQIEPSVTVIGVDTPVDHLASGGADRDTIIVNDTLAKNHPFNESTENKSVHRAYWGNFQKKKHSGFLLAINI